jgi:calcineurin-like phosphoesterase family protein/galactitol-specific phosphotransferase system IIB component
MSKIFLVGDVHIGLGYPNNTDKWFKIHQEYFNDFLIPILKKESKPGDILVQLGDLFDNRNVIPINLLNYGIDIIEEMSKILPIHIIIGNHDIFTKSASDINSVRPLRYIPNIKIYNKTEIFEYNNIKILMMPFVEKRLEQIKLIDENKNCDYLFCHSDLNGCRMHLTSVAKKNPDKIDIKDFKSFKKVKSGHIHITQRNGIFQFIGSIFQMDRNDMGDQKGILILDTKNETEQFIPNKISPVFKKLTIATEDDVEKLDELKETKDYIDLLISNKLLISNRKLRRKLEVMLEKGNFASVEYIDDISEELVEGDEVSVNESGEIIDNENQNISIQLEYEDYIKEYILKQNYDSDKTKSGIISEFDEIIRIYNENYKQKNE